ncbi:hypothetical protein [Paenibacillus sp. sgz302251]|uniref:hypothetical protein n=1 Tax=Paenibacillus sp. sgz302251 TaxID=3414493 RepID=UPI003C7D6F2F
MGKYEDDYKKLLEKRSRLDTANRKIVGEDKLLNVNEEMGADFAVGGPIVDATRREEHDTDRAERVDTETGGFALGWVSLVFAVASWFIWPVLLGVTAAVLGFIAYRQGARALGGWAMAIGLIALALNLIIVPLYYAIT